MTSIDRPIPKTRSGGIDRAAVPADAADADSAQQPAFTICPNSASRSMACARPQLWDMRGLIRFAAIMGPLSSLFDFLTFAVLIYVFNASPAEFRTTWFLESMATQILVIFIIRTNGRPWQDIPRPALVASSRTSSKAAG
jgi:magnesium-transporting ATPase (P-type)